MISADTLYCTLSRCPIAKLNNDLSGSILIKETAQYNQNCLVVVAVVVELGIDS